VLFWLECIVNCGESGEQESDRRVLLTNTVTRGQSKCEPWGSLGTLLAKLPLNSEDGSLREEISESDLVAAVEASNGFDGSSETLVVVIRRLLEALGVLDLASLSSERWAFVSFPASLVARSVLATLSNQANNFFGPEYWLQVKGRSETDEEEQRTLLRRIERQRVSIGPAQVEPIRTVHVTWGLIRIEGKFLLRQREDKTRQDFASYVFPGGRLDLADLQREQRTSSVLRDLFEIDSVIAKQASEKTLARELWEELGLAEDEFSATYLRTLTPYRMVEGARNHHAFTQWNIAIFSVELSRVGELKIFDRIITDNIGVWGWFDIVELVRGNTADGLRPFVDALLTDKTIAVPDFLEKVPDSRKHLPFYGIKSDAIELPNSPTKKIRKGDVGRQRPVEFDLGQQEWELLMLLGWHCRGLPIRLKTDQFVLAAGGWIKSTDSSVFEAAKGLARRMGDIEFRLLDCDPQGFFRLSVASSFLFFQSDCFEYLWDIESEEKPICLRLNDIETQWATLLGKELSIRLSPAMVKAMPELERGGEPDADPETVTREFRRLMEPSEAIGLHQFIARKLSAHEILIPRTSLLR
jgi:8-oxo-dGTP pyrophosphatase MutT (NUDIX family)